MSLKDQMKKDAEEHGMGGNANFFRFDKSGVFRIRLLTNVQALATHFFGKGQSSAVCYGYDKGCPFHGELAPKKKDPKTGEMVEAKPAVKYMGYVLDRNDGRVKLGELPWSVVSKVSDFEEDEDYAFDGYPMPYDIKITVDKENKDPKEIYKVLASPKREPLTVEEENALMDKSRRGSVEGYIEKRKEQQIEKHKEEGLWQREQERREKLKAELDAIKPREVAEPVYAAGKGPEDIAF